MGGPPVLQSSCMISYFLQQYDIMNTKAPSQIHTCLYYYETSRSCKPSKTGARNNQEIFFASRTCQGLAHRPQYKMRAPIGPILTILPDTRPEL